MEFDSSTRRRFFSVLLRCFWKVNWWLNCWSQPRGKNRSFKVEWWFFLLLSHTQSFIPSNNIIHNKQWKRLELKVTSFDTVQSDFRRIFRGCFSFIPGRIFDLFSTPFLCCVSEGGSKAPKKVVKVFTFALALASSFWSSPGFFFVFLVSWLLLHRLDTHYCWRLLGQHHQSTLWLFQVAAQKEKRRTR